MSRDDHLQQQAWNYFALHAQQRLTTVNFYLVVATALTAAAVASFGDNFEFPGVRLAAGLLLSLLSFAFLEARLPESRADQSRGNRAPRLGS